jgi:hypothetical protein
VLAVLAVFREIGHVPFKLDLPMTISASNSCELRIQFLSDGVLDFETLDIAFTTVETTWVWRPEFLSTSLKARRPPDWVRIIQLPTPGKT